MPDIALKLIERIRAGFEERNAIFDSFFERESVALAAASRDMSDRFLGGGRLLAFGKGPYATDAQHVSVEFVHPVIVGKRALPALDLSCAFAPWLAAMAGPADVVMGFGPPEGDPEIRAALDAAAARGVMTFALPGESGNYAFRSPARDPFVHQELMEILYHTLWETVHVFFEHRELGLDPGDAAFLYPFLAQEKQQTGGLIDQVASSIRAKVQDDAQLRNQLAREQGDAIAQAAIAMQERIRRGGKLVLFGNGGSATDANDFAIDCFAPPCDFHPIPAVSLSMESANITALANDVGIEVVFMRQLAAQAKPDDIAVGFSTSGGSKNVIAAFEEARRRGLLTVALLGYDGGEIVRRGLCDHALVVRSDYIPRIQEAQASTYHIVRCLMETIRRGEA
jgi:D-sedoheptulose 7-phosphate isomerase